MEIHREVWFRDIRFDARSFLLVLPTALEHMIHPSPQHMFSAVTVVGILIFLLCMRWWISQGAFIW